MLQVEINKATDVVALFKTNKEQRKSFVDSVISTLENGNINPIQLHLQLKCMEEIFKSITANEMYKGIVLTECKKYGEKTFDFENSKIQIKEIGTKYDYTLCNDAALISLQKEFDKVNEALKERQEFLKKLPIIGLEVANSETGEINTIYPPSKSSITTPTVTLK